MLTHISHNSDKLNNIIITSSYPEPATSETTHHDIPSGILALPSVPAALPPTPGIGSTFLIPSAAKAKTRKRTAMIIAGREALLEAEEGEEEMWSGSGGGGKEEEEERGGGEGREKVAALAPDRRRELQTHFLQQRLQRLRDEAEFMEEQSERLVKRQRIRRVRVKRGEETGEGTTKSRNPMDVATRAAKLQEGMARETGKDGEETSDNGRWVRKRLELNLREREGLLALFGRVGI